MRLISQDGMIDVPYEYGSLCQGFIKGEEHLIYTISYYNYSSQRGTKLAEYSSKDKALKVVEMLRNAYCGKVIFQNVTIGEDVLELMKEWKTQAIISKTDPESRIEYINNNIFVFPKDSEVEV